MIDRFEILASRIRRTVNRNRWMARLLGLAPAARSDHETGLVMIQVDGLQESILREAIADGRMPFLKRLQDEEHYSIHSLYSGMPSSTPGFQAELLFGVRTAVPAFGFYDRRLRRVMSMNEPFSAAHVETNLLRENDGLLRDGSAWSDLFSGDAEESHFCASTAGLDMILRAVNPLRALGLVVWNLWSVVRVLATFALELVLAIGDFVRRATTGRDLRAELLFVPERVMVSAVMREIVAAGACVDTERGLPVIHLNLLGYDEHAHRRGPRSPLARWSLRGIDRTIRRVWMAAHRSTLRDYQVWIYSDHGQESTTPWHEARGEALPSRVRRTVHELFPDLERADSGTGDATRAIGGLDRAHWLRRELPLWFRRGGKITVGESLQSHDAGSGDGRPEQVVVIDQGPVGSITLPRQPQTEELDRLARALVQDVGVPHVMRREEDGVVVHRHDGTCWRLPEDAAEVFGPDHPHLHALTDDVRAMVHHPDAGDLVLMGFDRERPLSLQSERGAHGGPGPHETSAFALLPSEAAATPATMRASDLRALARRTLGGRVDSGPRASIVDAVPPDTPGCEARVLTYNVHGCRGMDGRYSPQRIARVIARQNPDVVCLQEVEAGRHRSGRVDQAERIARALESEFHFHAVAEVDDGEFGNAILSRHPMRLVDAGRLPRWRARLGQEDRGVLWAAIDVGGQTLHVLDTHLSIYEQERRLQIDGLFDERWLAHPELQDAVEHGAVVLCGDFNAPGRSANLARLHGMLRNVASPDRIASAGPDLNTWSSRFPMRRIDHVFVSAAVRVQGVQVPRSRLTRVASDHLPVVVDLWWPEQ